MDTINAAGGMLSPADASVKLAIAIGIGMLVGLEREWAKAPGARTFAITAMLGTLGMLANPAIAYIAFGGVSLSSRSWPSVTLSDRKPVEARPRRR